MSGTHTLRSWGVALSVMEVQKIHQGHSSYPYPLINLLGEHAPSALTAIGNFELLKAAPLALFCSVRCPGSLILKTFDLAQQLREAETAVISGFHSPVERDCLTTLLRGRNQLIVCLARGIEGMRIPADYQKPLDLGRLLLLSPFSKTSRRSTKVMAGARNAFVAALADEIFVAYAEADSKTEALCRDIVAWRKPLYSFDDSANANLLALGAKSVTKSRRFL